MEPRQLRDRERGDGYRTARVGPLRRAAELVDQPAARRAPTRCRSTAWRAGSPRPAGRAPPCRAAGPQPETAADVARAPRPRRQARRRAHATTRPDPARCAAGSWTGAPRGRAPRPHPSRRHEPRSSLTASTSRRREPAAPGRVSGRRAAARSRAGRAARCRIRGWPCVSRSCGPRRRPTIASGVIVGERRLGEPVGHRRLQRLLDLGVGVEPLRLVARASDTCGCSRARSPTPRRRLRCGTACASK